MKKIVLVCALVLVGFSASAAEQGNMPAKVPTINSLMVEAGYYDTPAVDAAAGGSSLASSATGTGCAAPADAGPGHTAGVGDCLPGLFSDMASLRLQVQQAIIDKNGDPDAVVALLQVREDEAALRGAIFSLQRQAQAMPQGDEKGYLLTRLDGAERMMTKVIVPAIDAAEDGLMTAPVASN
jgi:hypothetical protein